MRMNRRSSIKHILAAALFCMVLGMGMICYADEQGTVTVESAKIRASADTASEQLGSVAKGGTVDIIGETTGTDGRTWYQIYVDANTKGYVRADLIEKAGGSSSTAGTSSQPAATTATAVEAKKGTVVSNNVRIRTGASTSHDIVATANRGMVVTVTGEAAGADGKTWYQVSFTYNNKEITGFIRSDLVTFDNVPADTAVSEIVGEENSTEISTEEQTEEETQEETQQTTSANDAQNIILMNVDETPYIMPGFQYVTINWNDQNINAYKNGNFYIFYAQKQNGEEGWFVCDTENYVYQRYVYAVEGVNVPEEENKTESLLPLIVLVIIIVILLAVIGLMFLKLREYSNDYEDDDEEEDDEYSDDDDIEDLEELEDDMYEEEPPAPQPVRRPRPQNGQPVRRPQPASNDARPQQQPVRRPQPQNGQPVRRPQPSANDARPQQQSAAGVTRPQQQNGQPVRRPQPQQEGGAQIRRRPEEDARPANNRQGTRSVNGQGQASNPGRKPNPNSQQRPAQPQRGAKAKPILDTENEDMEFIDI